MFEMLGLFDDALIQFDELDALFSQFVANHASGRKICCYLEIEIFLYLYC